MNYLRFPARLRQASCCFSLAAALIFAANVSAQQRENQPEQIGELPGAVKTTEKQTEKNQPSSAAQDAGKTADFDRSTDKKDRAEPDRRFAARNFSEFSNDEIRLARSSFYKPEIETEKSAPEQQSSDGGGDTMMGVMGKATDSIKLGGHVGFVVPVVGRGGGVTTNLADRFVFGFPVGLTLKTKRNIAIDFEFIPTFNTGRDFVLTVHPGIIYGFAKKYAVGVRAAYDAGNQSFGFTPLISRGFKINEKVGFFVEADFPIRSNYRAFQDRFGSIAFAAHAGFAF